MSPLRQIEIESIAAGGDGVGRSEGLVFFTPRSAPGDLATVSYTTKGSFARASLRSIERQSPLRVDPRCGHYTKDRCGGCQIQHLDYAAQLEQKRLIVRDALARIGKRAVEKPEIAASPKQWEYRTKLTLAIRAKGGARIAGLHRFDNPAEVFDLRQCPITDSRVVDMWLEIKRYLHLLPDDDGELRGSVRVSEQGITFVLLGAFAWPRQEEFADALKTLVAIWWEPREGRRRLIADRRKEAAPLASFAQVNPATAALLRAHVLARVRQRAPSTLIDAYSGNGDMAVEIAGAGVGVTAIELDPDASRWASDRMPSGSVAINSKVEDALEDALPAQVILLNPPRAGVDERVTSILELTVDKPDAVIYTSCNPATLARDIARMPGYRISGMKVFDMFPQTAHVETVCELVPEAA